MTTLDWFIVSFTALLAWRGFRIGFVAGALSLGGAFAGLYLGSRLASFLVSGGLSSVYGFLIPIFAVFAMVLVGRPLPGPSANSYDYHSLARPSILSTGLVGRSSGQPSGWCSSGPSGS